MILNDSNRDEFKRMDFVSIVTPNHLHFEPAKLALEKGLHVFCNNINQLLSI
jgi:predicted dehydrogenase